MKDRKLIHDKLAENKIIPVLTTEFIDSDEDAIALAKAHYDAGCKVIEFMLRSKNVPRTINPRVFEKIRKACPDMMIGIGTCVTPYDIKFAKAAGADFCVSANFSWACIEAAAEQELFYLPGVGELSRFHALITGEERSPTSGKTVQTLLGGAGVATLKVHSDASTDLIDMINETIMNPYQRQYGSIEFVDLELSELVHKNWGIGDITMFSKKDNVAMLGGTYTYMRPNEKDEWENLIEIKDWVGITELTTQAMAVTHEKRWGAQPPLQKITVTANSLFTCPSARTTTSDVNVVSTVSLD